MSDEFADVVAAGMDRRAFLKYTGMVGAATAITASLAACTTQASTSATTSAKAAGTAGHPAGTITATLAFQLSGGFDPMNASSAVATCINQHIFEALVDLDPVTRAPYPALAKAIPSASADGLTWTATLRDGAKFSDGTLVTADDVVWSFTRVMNPANDAIIAPFITSFLDSVTATGPSTVQFRLKSPFVLFPERIAVIKIVPKALTDTAAAAKAFDSSPVGSGPFKLVSASVSAGGVLADNASYNGPRPALVTQIVMGTSTNNAARIDNLEGGQSQAIEEVPYLSVTSLPKPNQADNVAAFNGLFLMFNCSAPPFNDKRVRQALLYAIDTNAVITTALNGYGQPATSYLNAANPDYQQAATVYGYDPAKAKSLLAAAGASNLSFTLVTTSTSFVADSAPVIIDNWKQIGVTATLNTAPSAQVYAGLVPASGFRVLAASGDPSIYGPDADLILRWFYDNPEWMVNRARWNAPERTQLSALINQAAAQSGSTQQATWKQAFDLIADQVPLYMVYHTDVITGFNPTQLTNFRGAPTTGVYFLSVGRAT